MDNARQTNYDYYFFRSNSIAGAFCGNNFTSGLVPAANTWQFVSWIWNNTTGKETIYFNNQKAERTTSGINMPDLTKGYIGGVYANWYFQGLIDEIRIYNRILSADEIKALYEATR